MWKYQRKHSRRCKCYCHYQFRGSIPPSEEHCSTCAPYWEPKPFKRIAQVGGSKRKKLIKSIDSIVSLIVRIRGDWTCVKCKKKYRPQVSSRTNLPAQNMMTNSHFFKRGLWGTRWDFDNQDAMCTFCHSAIENHKTDWIEGFNYQEFMVAKIGVSGLEALRIKSEREMHFKEWELKKIEAEMKITLERLLDYQGDSRLIHK